MSTTGNNGTTANLHSVSESEWQTIAAMVRGGAATVTQVRKIAQFSDFDNRDLAAAFRHIERLTEQGVRVTKPELQASLADEFGKAGHLYAGTNADMAESVATMIFTTPVGTVENATWHAQRVAEAALMRRATSDLSGLLERARVWDGNAHDLISQVLAVTTGLTVQADRARGESGPSGRMKGVRLSDAMDKFWDGFKSAYNNPQALIGHDTGFSLLNRNIRGLRPSRLHILAGPSGEGKSALASNLVTNSASARVAPAAWHVHSYEMEHDELIERMAFSESQVDSQRYLDGALTDHEWNMLEAARERLKSTAITIFDDPNMTMSDIADLARRGRAEGTCDAVLIDYTQLVTPENQSGRKSLESREREVSEIVKSGKRLAQELHIPVVMLSQLNDDGKMRESRDIKNHADVVLILQRDEDPDEAHQRAKRNNESIPEIQYTLVIDKCRKGRRGKVPLKFRDSLTRFDEEFRDDF